MDLKKLDVKNTEVKLGEKYLLKERLGGGSFGQIFCAVNIENQARVAAKMEKRSVNATLIREAKVISDMRGHTGFPSLYDYGKEENYNYIIISLLGWNLEKLFKLCSQRFSLKTVLMIADQLLSRIETLHTKNYIHRDIKPENFCIGKGSSGRNVFLIDFGLAKAFKDSEGKHISFKEGKGLIGTARYASINAHLGYELSRRDDLESIGYALVYFLAGKLPWQNLKVEEKQEKYQRIAELKIQTPTDQLCQGLPTEFLTYLNYVKKLEFEEIPDYKYLKKLFRTLFVEYGYDFDYNYDWLDVLKTQYSIETTIVPALKVKDPARVEEPKKHNTPTSIQIPQKGDVADSPSNKKQKKEEKDDKKSDNELKVHEGPSSFVIPIRKRSSSRPTVILNDKKVKSTTEQQIQNIPPFRKSLNATTLPKIALIETESKDEDKNRKKSYVRGSFPMNMSSNSAFSSKNLHYNMTPSIINEDREDDIPTEAIENMLGSTVGKVKQFSVKKKDISLKVTEQFSPMSPKEHSFKHTTHTQTHTAHGGRKSFNQDIKKAQFPSFMDSRRSPLNDFSLLDPKRISPRWSDANEIDGYFDEGNLNENSICEWEEKNNLEQMVNQKRFFINPKNH